MPSQKVFLDWCLSWVIVDEETSTVRFIHFTLEEYFRDHIANEFPNGYSSIAETCLTYLNFGKLRQSCTGIEALRQKMTEYALLGYAAPYSGTNIKQSSNDGLKRLVRILVEHESECPPWAIQALSWEIDSGNSSVVLSQRSFRASMQ